MVRQEQLEFADTGTDSAYVADREVFEGYTHRQLWELVREKLLPTELARLSDEWSTAAGTLETAFDDFAREIAGLSGAWCGVSAGVARRAAETLIRAGDAAATVCRTVEHLLAMNTTAAETLRAAIPEPPAPYEPDPDPAVEAATGAERRTIHDTVAADLEAAAQDAMTYIYNPTMAASGDAVPRFPIPTSRSGGIDRISPEYQPVRTPAENSTTIPSKVDSAHPDETTPGSESAANGRNPVASINLYEGDTISAGLSATDMPTSDGAAAGPTTTSPGPLAMGRATDPTATLVGAASVPIDTPLNPSTSGAPGRPGSLPPGGDATPTGSSVGAPPGPSSAGSPGISRPSGVLAVPGAVGSSGSVAHVRNAVGTNPSGISGIPVEAGTSFGGGTSGKLTSVVPDSGGRSGLSVLQAGGAGEKAAAEQAQSGQTLRDPRGPLIGREPLGAGGARFSETSSAAGHSDVGPQRAVRLVPAGIPVLPAAGVFPARGTEREQGSPDYLHTPNEDLIRTEPSVPPVLGDYVEGSKPAGAQSGSESRRR